MYKQEASQIITNEATIDGAVKEIDDPSPEARWYFPSMADLNVWADNLADRKSNIETLKASIVEERIVLKRLQADIVVKEKEVEEFEKHIDSPATFPDDTPGPILVAIKVMTEAMNPAIRRKFEERKTEVAIMKEFARLLTNRHNFVIDLANNREKIIDRSIAKVETLKAHCRTLGRHDTY